MCTVWFAICIFITVLRILIQMNANYHIYKPTFGKLIITYASKTSTKDDMAQIKCYLQLLKIVLNSETYLIQ